MPLDFTDKQQPNQLKCEKFEMTLTKNGMLKIVYTEGTQINMEVILLIEKMGKLLLGDKKAYMLIDASLANGVTRKAFKYLQQTKEHHRIGGFAILIKSMMGRIIGNFSIKLYPVLFPKRLFEDEKEAILWLKNLKSHSN